MNKPNTVFLFIIMFFLMKKSYLLGETLNPSQPQAYLKTEIIKNTEQVSIKTCANIKKGKK